MADYEWKDGIPVYYSDKDNGRCFAAEIQGPELQLRELTDPFHAENLAIKFKDPFKLAMKEMGFPEERCQNEDVYLLLNVRDARFLVMHLLHTLATMGCPVSIEVKEIVDRVLDQRSSEEKDPAQAAERLLRDIDRSNHGEKP